MAELTTRQKLIVAGLALWLAVQILVPLRHLLYPGNVSWTEQGHRFAWMMKLRDKDAEASFTVRDPATGRLWTIEHGAAGGDELNHPEAGRNYGWPVITYGRDYNGARIGVGAVRDGMEQPVYYWDPVIAPGGLAFYNGSKFAGWKGSILAGSMVPGGLVRLTMQDGRVVADRLTNGSRGG